MLEYLSKCIFYIIYVQYFEIWFIFNYLTWTSTKIGKWKLIDPGSKKKPANIDIKFLIVWPSHFKSCY